MKLSSLASFLCAFALSLSVATAENWPNWRGPQFNGSTSETGLPRTFSKSENVRWVVSMPGPSASTPVIWGDRVFVSTVDEAANAVSAMCLDRSSGEILWKHQVASRVRQDNRSNYASPSPVTNGELVWFFYGTGDLICFDVAGEKVWERNIEREYGDFAFLWTFSSSPVLYDDKLYLQVLQRDVPARGGATDNASPIKSYLLAMDPKTGKELWRHFRPSNAVAESREAFTTPMPFTYQGREELVVAGGDALTGHDPDTGRELWRWGTWNPNRIGHWRLVASPLAANGVILACAPKREPVFAVQAGKSGTLSNSDLAWVSEDREVSSDVATPLYYQGKIYLLNTDRKTISRLEPATGAIDWTGELPTRSKLEASPTGADGRIYLMDHEGTVFVVKAQDSFEVEHQAEFGSDEDRELRSTIAVASECLFIRTNDKLYCVGN